MPPIRVQLDQIPDFGVRVNGGQLGHGIDVATVDADALSVDLANGSQQIGNPALLLAQGGYSADDGGDVH